MTKYASRLLGVALKAPRSGRVGIGFPLASSYLQSKIFTLIQTSPSTSLLINLAISFGDVIPFTR